MNWTARTQHCVCGCCCSPAGSHHRIVASSAIGQPACVYMWNQLNKSVARRECIDFLSIVVAATATFAQNARPAKLKIASSFYRLRSFIGVVRECVPCTVTGHPSLHQYEWQLTVGQRLSWCFFFLGSLERNLNFVLRVAEITNTHRNKSCKKKEIFQSFGVTPHKNQRSCLQRKPTNKTTAKKIKIFIQEMNRN